MSVGRKDIVIPTPGEIALLRGAASPLIADGIQFSAYTGVRLGECMALGDIEAAGSPFGAPFRLAVDRQLTRAGGYKPPKGGHTRTIVVPPQALSGSVPGPLMRLSRTAHHDLWDEARCAIGRPDLAWHGLRHFAATWWLERFAESGRPGVDPYAMTAIQLGHRDGGRLCRELYGHYESVALDEMARLVS